LPSSFLLAQSNPKISHPPLLIRCYYRQNQSKKQLRSGMICLLRVAINFHNRVVKNNPLLQKTNLSPPSTQNNHRPGRSPTRWQGDHPGRSDLI
jgi:hypothetical protein